ncbi:hypothetical protein BU17DRAFT_68010 [Hysterangium stoloniferum]|nr:hypothetical protein BU17DRAFT_68010 [Hysterangium stoloniferum]
MSTTLEVVQIILAAVGDFTIPIESLISTVIVLSLECIAKADHNDKTEEGDEGVQARLVNFLKGTKASEAGEQWLVTWPRDIWNGGWTALQSRTLNVDTLFYEGPNIPPTDILAGDAPKPSPPPDLFAVIKATRDILTCNASRLRSGTMSMSISLELLPRTTCCAS